MSDIHLFYNPVSKNMRQQQYLLSRFHSYMKHICNCTTDSVDRTADPTGPLSPSLPPVLSSSIKKLSKLSTIHPYSGCHIPSNSISSPHLGQSRGSIPKLFLIRSLYKLPVTWYVPVTSEQVSINKSFNPSLVLEARQVA